MPRRYYSYLPEYHSLHVFATVGSWVMVTGLVIMISNLIRGLYAGDKAEVNPWGGTTLEWRVPSPPPLENFEDVPLVVGGPYNHESDSYIMHPGKEKKEGN